MMATLTKECVVGIHDLHARRENWLISASLARMLSAVSRAFGAGRLPDGQGGGSPAFVIGYDIVGIGPEFGPAARP